MSRRTYNFRQTSGNWIFPPNYTDPNHVDSIFPRSRSFQATPDFRRRAPEPSGSVDERMMTGPLGLYSLAGQPQPWQQPPPWQPHPPLQILVLDHMAREANSWPGQRDPPPRPLQVSRVEDDSKLTLDEQKKALKNLKKEIYNPGPKRLSRRLCLYYRDNTQNMLKEMEKEKDEDGKRCAICLEDFEPREEVTLTPCNHMFHEDCITPWVKSNGQCPVCRYAFCKPMRGTASNVNNNNIAANVPAAANNNVSAVNNLSAEELMSIFTAMWGDTTR